MKRIVVILLLGFLWPIYTNGQGESNNWYFGYQVGLQFNADGSITQFDNSVIDAPEGSASVSDAQGNLLFYTDGANVYDRTHSLMMNGTGLITNPTGTQTALIVPDPGDSNLLYIFSVDATTSGVRGTGLNYSVVDMRLNNGNGAVITKNTNLLEDCAEKITAVIQDCQTRSIWIIAQATETGQRVLPPTFPDFNTLHAFELTPAGVSNTSVKSTFNTITVLDDRGYIKISPDKTKLASANMRDGLLIYDFDVATGLFSNQQRIHMSGLNYAPYGVEFSPNSRYLYVHASNNRSAYDGHTSDLSQYDLTAADITGSQILLDTSDIYRGALQMANNGKIYRALSVNFETGIPFLGVINNPDTAGLAADYQHQGLALNTGTSSVGLPPLVPSFYESVDFLPKDADDNNAIELVVCEGEPLLLEVQDIVDGTYTWEKDNVVFNNPTRNIYRIDAPTAADEGVYKVTLTRPYEIECPVFGEISVTLDAVPVADPKTLIVCDDDIADSEDGLTTINLREIENDDTSTYSYYLTLDNLNDDISIPSPEEFMNTLPFGQSIYYRISNAAGCSSNAELFVQVEPKSTIVLEESYLICMNDPQLSIMGPENFDAYRWLKINENETSIVSQTQEFNAIESGDYILEAINIFSFDGNTIECISTASFEVSPSATATIDDLVVNGSTVQVAISGEGDYEFSLDGVTYQDENILQVVAVGEINVFVRDKNGCGVTSETIEQDLTVGRFPKFFTPNGDGANDYWQFIPPIVQGEVECDVIHIFTRYGYMLAQIDPKSVGWNGMLAGRPLPATDYWYKAIFSDESIVTGNMSLKR
ncbi:T9SS type B sorting domain-containing protein [Maribacter algarum]|uniref:T9SS type B sorting domain-containing protein n=1 Tax=Maribacter algarum (ex Zhang et al. 2020) TaxID=2578118 RepID=A0A5S3PT87_9FLAO|nr:T9SS type B sorting domain-containing protein [Maribacter algarum]TMM58206.1 T9SS type B sorting domain-containing protein [Maribacter algarum]